MRFRPSSSFCILSSVGITAAPICMKIEAEMYGMMPRAKTVDRERFPPTNRSYSPRSPPPWFCWKNAIIAFTSTPGTVTCEPMR